MSILKRLINVLAPAGIALTVGVVIWSRAGKTLPGVAALG